jgi:hypothetical protein
MTLSPTVFALGVLGGALGELLKWYQLRESPNLPEYTKKPFYWIITVLMILVGGMLALLQGLDGTKPLLALNIGISAPLILKGLANIVPSEKPPATKGVRGPEAQTAKPRAIDFIAGR